MKRAWRAGASFAFLLVVSVAGSDCAKSSKSGLLGGGGSGGDDSNWSSSPSAGSGQTCHPGGTPCQGYAECCSQVCANQVCTTCGAKGEACNVGGGCCVGLVCYQGTCGQCKVDNEPCSLASECCSNICEAGVCGACHPMYAPCTQDFECCSGNVCTGGYCQPPPNTTSSGPTTTAGPSTSAGPTSTTTGGGGACDNSGACSTCANCAEQGACASEYNACASSQDCIDFANCVGNCSDQTCTDNCTASYPAGVDLYVNFAQCVVCGSCFNDCDGASGGC